MKVGSHGNESFEDIIERKKTEEKSAGFNLWGYSGTLLDPRVINKTLNERWKSGEKIFLLMAETPSPFKNSPWQSTSFSLDRSIWFPLPPGTGTRGCDKALVCRGLARTDLDVNISAFRVAAGPSKGKRLTTYLKNRTDKVCAVYDPADVLPPSFLHTTWIAELLPPFALYLGNNQRSQLSLFHNTEELGVFGDLDVKRLK